VQQGTRQLGVPVHPMRPVQVLASSRARLYDSALHTTRHTIISEDIVRDRGKWARRRAPREPAPASLPHHPITSSHRRPLSRHRIVTSSPRRGR
jgi:hypothetical protein